jgi:hypothetical protein
MIRKFAEFFFSSVVEMDKFRFLFLNKNYLYIHIFI